MRARNREINIFNMSLLDILTGMLGAFLFLMLGMLPYYAKMQQTPNAQQLAAENKALKEQADLDQKKIENLQKQLDELQKIVKQAAGGPMTAEQIQQLMDQMNKLREQVDQLNADLQSAKDQLAQAQQQLQQAQQQAQQAMQQAQQAQQQMQQAQQEAEQARKDTNFWSSQLPVMTLISNWDSPGTDIDVFVMTPDGEIFGQKKEKILGKDVTVDGSDSHGADYSTAHEGLVVFPHKSGDFLVFYRVPQKFNPADYVGLEGHFMLYGVQDREKNLALVWENSLVVPNASQATSPGLYAWCTLHWDDQKLTMDRANLPATLPPGITRLVAAPASTPAPSPSVPGFNIPGFNGNH